MQTQPLWNLWDTGVQFPKLENNLSVDVAIVGGGITGITTAMLLSEKGFNVVVLEARSIGKGTTGQSTGNLYEMTEDLFSVLDSKYDKATLNIVHAARRKGIELIKDAIENFNIDCDFHPRNMYVFEDGWTDKIKKETKIALEANIPVKEIPMTEFPFRFKNGMQLNNQAQFNPLLYVQQLANQITTDTCRIFENTKVEEIKDNETGFVLKTSHGNVSAKYVVHATHTPKGRELQYHTTLGPYREYGIAAKVVGNSFPPGIFWKYEAGDKYSIRSYARNHENFILVIGKPHKTGQMEDTVTHIKSLHNFLHENFSVEKVLYQWGAQNYKPADHLPYIGRIHENSNEFVATGFAADGLVWGCVAADIITDAIVGKENNYEDFFKASRHRPIKAAGRFLKENLNMAGYLIKDVLAMTEDFEKIKKGQASVVKKDDKKVAVFRDDAGEYHIVSAICPHLGCTVHWNKLEKTWDCPCHASRFDIEGNVIEGPAFNGLEKFYVAPDKN